MSEMLAPHARALRVLEVVCEAFGVPFTALRSKSRRRALVDARRGAIVILREDHGLTVSAIGGILRRDHSTIVYNLAQGFRQVSSVEALQVARALLAEERER